MRAGELRHRITLQYPKRTPDSFSSVDVVWTDSATIWASVWPVRSDELIDNERKELAITHRFRLRYRKGVKQEMRIMFKGNPYNIVSIINKDERNIYLEILASDRT